MGKCKNAQRWRIELITNLKIVQATFIKDPYQMSNTELLTLATQYGVTPPPTKPYVRGMTQKEKKYYGDNRGTT
jgi:hypothetical protein